VVTGTGGAAVSISLAGVGWPAVSLGGIVTLAAVWVVSSPDRTRNLADLIRAVRGERPPN